MVSERSLGWDREGRNGFNWNLWWGIIWGWFFTALLRKYSLHPFTLLPPSTCIQVYWTRQFPHTENFAVDLNIIFGCLNLTTKLSRFLFSQKEVKSPLAERVEDLIPFPLEFICLEIVGHKEGVGNFQTFVENLVKIVNRENSSDMNSRKLGAILYFPWFEFMYVSSKQKRT